jgi:hypothetical protein
VQSAIGSLVHIKGTPRNITGRKLVSKPRTPAREAPDSGDTPVKYILSRLIQ